jgi:hypothetical protein
MPLLKPSESVIASVAMGTMVVGIYSVALPHTIDVRASNENDAHVASSEKAAAWISAGAVSGLSFLLRDPTMFVTGAVMVIGLSWWYRHSNTINPAVGRIGSILPDYNAGDVAPDYLTAVS